jgi:hypothetical protein
MIALFSPHPGHRGRSRRTGQDEPEAIPEKGAPSLSSLADGVPAPLAAPVPEASPQEPGAGTPSLSWRTSLEEAEAAVTAASRELDGEQEQAARDPGARRAAVVTDGDGEPLPRRVPGATLPSAPEPGSPADQVAGYLAAPDRADAGQMRDLLNGLRNYNPRERGATMPNPAVREPPPAPAPRSATPAPVPGAAVLLSLSRTARTVAQPLDGLPERRTAGGKPVVHLGDDPRNDGEAFAVGGMSDAYLDGLIAVLMDERSARLKARDAVTRPAPVPVFTPCGTGDGGDRDDC